MGEKEMVPTDTAQQTVIRTERGLTVAGTRITLYDVMDYVTAAWPPKLIQDWLNLNDRQIADVMEYIAQHRDEVEAEYRTVLQEAEEERRYWEERNRERFAQAADLMPQPGQESIRAKLAAWKARQREP